MEKKNVFAPSRLDSRRGPSLSTGAAAAATAAPPPPPPSTIAWDWAAVEAALGGPEEEAEAEYAALVALLGAVCPAFRCVAGGARERVLARRVESALHLEGAALYDGRRRLVPAARLAPATRRRVAALARQYLDEDAEQQHDAAALVHRAVAVDLRRCRPRPSLAKLVDVGAAKKAPEPAGNFF